ncbi:MAG: putative NBD/HSP70 family sugar kinase [Granulosicoccus sp.]|jgi:predicted NBD/HSP70 family sugar kinase
MTLSKFPEVGTLNEAMLKHLNDQSKDITVTGPYVIGVDVSTVSARAGVFDLSGELLEQVGHFIDLGDLSENVVSRIGSSVLDTATPLRSGLDEAASSELGLALRYSEATHTLQLDRELRS